MPSVLIDAPTAYFGDDVAVSLPTGTITVPLQDGVTGEGGDGSYEVVFTSNEDAVYGVGPAGPALHCIKGVAYYDQRVHRIGSFLVINGALAGNQDLRTIGGVTTANIQNASVTPEKLTGKIVATVSGVEPIIVDDTDTTNPIVKLDVPLAVIYGGTGTATPKLTEGNNITITGTWPDLTITAAGYTGDGTIAQTQVHVDAPITNSGSTTAPQLGLQIPLGVQYGGTGTLNPALTAGSNITITGTWPNLTIGVTNSVQTLEVTSPVTLGGTALNPVLGLQIPLPVNMGGTGSPTPSLIEGDGITIAGTWPNQIVSATGGSGSGPTYLREDGDVALTDPANGQVLTYSGGEWINADASGSIVLVVAPLTNTGTTTHPIIGLTNPLPINKGGSGSAAPALIAGANITITGLWPNQTIAATGGGSGGSSTLAADTDVAIASPVNGQILTYESGKWINAAAPIPASSTAVAEALILPSDFAFHYAFPNMIDTLTSETGVGVVSLVRNTFSAGYKSDSSSQTWDTTTAAASVPPTIGNLLVLEVLSGCSYVGSTLATPAGWELLYTNAVGATNNYTAVSVFFKVASSGDTGAVDLSFSSPYYDQPAYNSVLRELAGADPSITLYAVGAQSGTQFDYGPLTPGVGSLGFVSVIDNADSDSISGGYPASLTLDQSTSQVVSGQTNYTQFYSMTDAATTVAPISETLNQGAAGYSAVNGLFYIVSAGAGGAPTPLTDEAGTDLSSEADSSTSMQWWCVAGSLYLPDGTVATYPANGSASIPNMYSSSAEGDSVYAIAYAKKTGTTWGITITLMPIRPNAAQLAAAYQAGVVPLIAIYNSLVGTTGSGNNGTLLGGAGSSMIC